MEEVQKAISNFIEIKNPNKVIIKQLEDILLDLKDARMCIFEDDCARTGINRAVAKVEFIKSLLEG